MSPKHFWIGIFALWAVLLSGILAGVVGSPGMVQAVRLRSLLSSKQEQLRQIQVRQIRLEAERLKLEKSRVAQEHEIRRVLGYAARDEIIFDFTSGERFGSE